KYENRRPKTIVKNARIIGVDAIINIFVLIK
ncbi:unnamed protein product, partial [marine sediment metagenome]